MFVNLAVVMGRLTREPELQPLQNTSVCRFTVAVNEPYKDRKSGEFKEVTSYVDVEVWGAAAERFVQKFNKGDLIVVQGRLRTDTWEDKNGNKRKRTFLRADAIRPVLRKKAQEGEEIKNDIDSSDLIDETEDIEF
jgi:single-strand DNA-binding protein